LTSFPLGIASKPSNIVDGLQILAAHVGTVWDEVVAMEAELLGGGTGQLILDIRPTTAGNVVLQSRQNTGDTQPRVQLLGTGSLKWGSGTAATDITLARSGTRTLTLTGSEIITPGNTADTALLIKGLASQTGLLLDIQNSAGTSEFSVTNSGVVTTPQIVATGSITAPTRSPGDNTTNVATTAFVTAAIVAGVPSGIPAGVVAQWAGGAAPTGWLLCDGSAVSRTTYATLFGAIGTTFGTGDGSTTFNLPDSRGRAVIGAGTGSGLTNRVKGTNGGAETVALTTSNLPSHDHGGGTSGATATGSAASTVAGGSLDTVAAHTHAPGTLFPSMDLDKAYNGSTVSINRFNEANTGGGGVIIDTVTFFGIMGGATASAGSHSHTFTGTGHTHTVSVNSHTHPIPAQGSGTAHTLMQPWLATDYIIKT
jgi:microcystin-dependent protein